MAEPSPNHSLKHHCTAFESMSNSESMEAPAECKRCRLLIEAYTGELELFKQVVKEFDNGRGLEKTFLSVKDREERTVLHWAARGGKSDICDYLVKEIKLDVNMKDGLGYTALLHAVGVENLSTTEFLIGIGADVSLSDLNGFAPLHLAADRGNTEILELLISKGADVNSIAEPATPLHVAAANGRKDAVKVLLSHNANPNSVGCHFFTPLFSSIMGRSFECLELLLKGGADPNFDSRGMKPLDIAVNMLQAKMVECLLKHGAEPNASGLRTIEGLQLRTENFQLCKEKGNEAFKKKNYRSALSWYNQAIDINPCEFTLFSNRSLCYARLNNGDKALRDALNCVKMNPNWPKAHYREGAAYKLLKNYRKAAEAFEKALLCDPHCKETEKELMEVEKLVSK